MLISSCIGFSCTSCDAQLGNNRLVSTVPENSVWHSCLWSNLKALLKNGFNLYRTYYMGSWEGLFLLSSLNIWLISDLGF